MADVKLPHKSQKQLADDSDDSDDIPQPPNSQSVVDLTVGTSRREPIESTIAGDGSRFGDVLSPNDYASDVKLSRDWKDLAFGDVVLQPQPGHELRKDDEFYLASMVIEVDEQLFNLPRSDLEKRSPVIQAMLASGKDVGFSDDNPLILTGMTNEEFNTFLEVLYLPNDSNEIEPDAWKSVLKVAFILQTDELYATAVSKLDDYSFNPIEKAELARTCDVEKWLRPAYEAICCRGTAIEVAEARTFGFDVALKLVRIREVKFSKGLGLFHSLKSKSTRCKESRSSELVFPDSPDDGFQETLDNSLFRAFQNIVTSENVAASKEATSYEFDDGELDDVPGPRNDFSFNPGSRHSYSFTFIVVKVEDCLFKVPQAILQDQSAVFQSMYTLPDGENEDDPLVLNDVTADEFRSFLKCTLKSAGFVDEFEEDWLITYKLASMWGFHRFRRIALAKLNGMVTDDIRRLELAKEYSVEEWLYTSLSALALRRESLTDCEAEQIGIDFAIPLFRVREEIMPERWRIMQSLMNVTDTVDGNSESQRECCFCNMEYTEFWFKTLNDESEKRIISYEITRAFGDLPGGPVGRVEEDEEEEGVSRTVTTQPSATAMPSASRAPPRSRASSTSSGGCCGC